MTEIRHVAAGAQTDAYFLTAEFERRVRVWSFAERALLAELDTALDFGGRRLALCDDGEPVVVAGAWERHGICAYALGGAKLWQRKDLRRPQHITACNGGSLVTACFDDRPMHVLDARSGETVATVRAIRGFYGSAQAGFGIGALDGQVALVDIDAWALRWKAPIEGFAVLSAAAAPGAIVVANVVGPGERASLSCLSVSGEVRWRWSAPPEVNCPALAWDGEASEWVGVLNHVNNERPDTLARWSPSGELVMEVPLALDAVYEFLPSGRFLVTSDGELRDTRDGAVVWELPMDTADGVGS